MAGNSPRECGRYSQVPVLYSTVLYCALLCSTVLYSGDNGAPWASVCTLLAGEICRTHHNTALASGQETWCSVAVCGVSIINNTAPTTIPLSGPQDGGEVAGDAVHLLLLLLHRGHRGLPARDEVQPRTGGGHGCGGGSSSRLEVGPAEVFVRVCKTSYVVYTYFVNLFLIMTMTRK